jgi:hypothetical protein
MIGKAIFDRLSNDAAVKAIVGNRVYPMISPDNVYPLITYQVHREPEDTIQPLVMKEFTITITMVTLKNIARPSAYSDLQALRAAVVAALDRQGGTWGGVYVKGFYLQDGEEDSYSDDANSEQTFYQAEDEYRVWAEA